MSETLAAALVGGGIVLGVAAVTALSLQIAALRVVVGNLAEVVTTVRLSVGHLETRNEAERRAKGMITEIKKNGSGDAS